MSVENGVEKQLTIRQLLLQRYPEPEFILMEEVSDQSGFNRSRSLDWMVAGIWASRGFPIIGIEQKSNRSDWIKELKDPKKQENHFKYCDQFYLFTTHENVAKEEEIPLTWGWLHRQGNRIRERKKAPKLEPVATNRSFMMALMRRAASKEGYILQDVLEDRVKEMVDIKMENVLRGDQAAQQLKLMEEKIKAFEEASGIDIGGKFGYWNKDEAERMGKIVNKLVQAESWGVKQMYKDLKGRAESIIKQIDRDLKEMKL